MSAVSNLLRPKLLDKLILDDLVPKLLMGIGLFSTLFFALGPLIAATRFLKSGISKLVVLEFMGWDFAGFISFTLPLAMLVAALLGFERLSRDSEAVALFAGGIRFQRMIVPVALLGLMVSLIGYEFNDHVASYANQRVADIKEHYEKYLGDSNKPNDFASNVNGRLITVHIERGFDVREQAMRQVTITVYDPDGTPNTLLYADRAQAHGTNFKSWTLINGTQAFLKSPGGISKFDRLETTDLNVTPDDVAFLQRDPETLNFSDLQRQINRLKAEGGKRGDILNAEVSLWFKTSLPFSCLIFGLVGAPLGMRSPRSAKVSGAVWALPIMLGYYVIYMTMSNVAQGGGVPPALAAWLPNILGLFVGAILIWKAAK
jgi:lipopolysaccharide export system permease protein